MAGARKSLGALLKSTFLLIKENLGSLAGIVAAVYVPLCLFFLLFFGSSALFKDKLDMASPNKSILAVVFFIVFFAVLVTATFLAMMLFSIAIIKKIQACDENKDLSLGEAYQFAVSILGPFCIVALWILVKISLWALLFIIPGVVFALFYSFAQLEFVLEGKRGMEALKASRDIIQPVFWEFVGKSLVVGMILLVVSGLFRVIIYFFFPSNTGWHPVVASVLENLVNGFLGVFPMTFGYLLYKNFKERT